MVNLGEFLSGNSETSVLLAGNAGQEDPEDRGPVALEWSLPGQMPHFQLHQNLVNFFGSS